MSSQTKIYTVAVQGGYEPAGFVVTHTDWYEWRENALITFIKRTRSEIENDATISAYLEGLAVVDDDDLGRYDIGASFDKNMVVIFAPNEDIVPTAGRDDVHLECKISVYTRNHTGLDSDKQEIGLVGDGTADHPSVLEVVEDLKALLRDNYLESGGERYVWQMRISSVEKTDDAGDLTQGINKRTLSVKGRRWDNRY
jgi:hypothetical protein